jgi:hypothetical protein
MKWFLLMVALGTATTVVSNAGAQENEANALAKWAADSLGDHKLVLDKSGRLLPWTSFDNVIKWSMNYIERCPTVRTKFGDDPWCLVTSKLTDKAEFMRNQNCQGSHAYWGVETVTRYYAYTGDEVAIKCIRPNLDRILYYHTPPDWAWPSVPRTQDNSPDGEYTDDTSDVDKICMVGAAYVKFYKLTGEKKYLEAARAIAKTIASHVAKGDAKVSPLPFRVNLKDGKVLYPYTAHMVAPVILFDGMIRLGETGSGVSPSNRDLLWRWVLTYPVKNNGWYGYYEDIGGGFANTNQQSPMETARFMLRHPELDPNFRQHVPALLAWVKHHFGKTTRYGATSICEQDACNFEMSSHTTRYASIAAEWFAVTQNPRDREEARASFALATYSAYSKYSKGDVAVNYVGIGYVNPWFIDSQF